MRGRPEKGSIASQLLRGAVAGAVGAVALNQVTWAIWNRQDPRSLEKEQEARPGGMDPAHVIANRMAERLGRTLTPKQPHPVGIATHYAFGIVTGAAYGVLRRRIPGRGLVRGLLFGLGSSLAQDELANWALGASAAPWAYPWQTHARGVAGHLAFGAASEATLQLFDRVAARRESQDGYGKRSRS